jgi:CRP/FNR family cyclic AMP-dependent transcriptional regulator
MPLTHELVAQFVGTSREIVTHYMNQFRRQGYLQYSRQRIILHCEALREWLGQHGSSGKRTAAASASSAA